MKQQVFFSPPARLGERSEVRWSVGRPGGVGTLRPWVTRGSRHSDADPRVTHGFCPSGWRSRDRGGRQVAESVTLGLECLDRLVMSLHAEDRCTTIHMWS